MMMKKLRHNREDCLGCDGVFRPAWLRDRNLDRVALAVPVPSGSIVYGPTQSRLPGTCGVFSLLLQCFQLVIKLT